MVGLVTHDPEMASFRVRMAALQPLMGERGLDARVIALGRGREWLRVARLARRLRDCDLLVFQQVKLLAGERALVRRLCPRWVLDVDDAIMFARPRAPGGAPSQAGWRRRRFRRMASRARLVVAGSESLAGMIRGAAPRLVVLPSPVDLAAYATAELLVRRPLRLVWIGLGSNLCYLEGVAPVLERLVAEGAGIELCVVSDRLPAMAGVPCRLIPWSVVAERTALADCDVGLAPLADDVWTRGKAGYRCIQYAAAGLPVVASAVGAQREVVRDGVTGLWATSPAEWRAALARLLASVGLRREMGAAARTHAQGYDIASVGPRYIEVLLDVLGGDGPDLHPGGQIPPAGRNAVS